MKNTQKSKLYDDHKMKLTVFRNKFLQKCFYNEGELQTCKSIVNQA